MFIDTEPTIVEVLELVPLGIVPHSESQQIIFILILMAIHKLLLIFIKFT